MREQRVKKKVDRAKEARRRARTTVGSPPPQRAIPDKRGKPPRHKKLVLDDEV